VTGIELAGIVVGLAGGAWPGGCAAHEFVPSAYHWAAAAVAAASDPGLLAEGVVGCAVAVGALPGELPPDKRVAEKEPLQPKPFVPPG